MSNRKFAIEVLQNKGEVVIQCNGSSMKPIIYPKEAIHLRKVDPKQLRVGDAVFCRVNGNLQVHKIVAMKDDRYTIGNNKGHVNDTVGQQSIFGLAVRIEDRVLVSDDELVARLSPNEVK